MKYTFYKKAYSWLVILTSFLAVNTARAQSNHTVSFSGNSSDFNSGEKYSAGAANTDYYVTYDATYVYFAAFRTGGNTFGAYDHFTVYVDTDPQSGVTSGGNGSTSGVNWDSNTPSLPIQADYRVCMRNNSSGESFYSNYSSGWSTGGTNGQGWVQYATSTALEVRVPWTDLGSPKAMYLAMYMSYNTGFYSPAPGSFSGSTLSGYFGGMGVTSTGFTPLSITNTPIIGSLTNGTPGNSYPYGYVNVTSGSYSPGAFTIQGGGTLNIAGGTLNAGSNTITFNSGTTMNYSSGTFNYNTSTLNFIGIGKVSGTVGLYDVALNGGVDFGTGTTINDSLKVNTGGYVNTNAPTYATNSYLVYNSVSAYGVNAEWTSNATSGTGVPYNVKLKSSSINFGASTAYRQLNGSLYIDGSSTLALSTASGGDIKVGGNWTSNGTFTPNGRAVFFTGTSQTINTATTFAYVFINSGSTTSIASSTSPTIANSITINGTFAPGANTVNFSSGASLTQSGTFTMGTSTINFLGTGTITGTIGFYNVAYAGGVDFGTGSTINDSLKVNPGGYVSTNAPTYATNSYLVYNSVTAYGVNAEWATNATSGAGVPYNVTLKSSSINFGSSTAYRQLNGNLNIGSGSTLALSTASGGDIKVGGSYTNNGTLTINSRAIYFVGTSTQTLAGGQSFPYLFVSNAAGVTVSGVITVSNTLTLTSGVLAADTVKVTNSATGAVTGYISDPTNGSYSSSSYVKGVLTRAITGTGQYDFPIGSSSNYELISIVGSSLTGTSTLTATYTTSNGSCSTPDPSLLSVNGTPIQTLLNGGFWTVTPDAEPTGGSYSAYINERGYTIYPSAASQMTLIKRNDCSSAWQTPGSATNSTQAFNSNTTTAQRTGLTSFSDFGIGWGDSPLPVTLESFTANAVNNTSVHTVWVVANQFNNKEFNVQRSTNGYEYNTIATVQGCGTCHDTRTYNSDDSKPLAGISYYRLMQADFDGKQAYSEAVPVNIKGNGFTSATIYPNPTTASATIWLDITGDTQGSAVVTVNDITGAVLITQNVAVTDGVTHTLLNTQNLPAGVYLVTVHNTSDGSNRVLRLVKSNQ